MVGGGHVGRLVLIHVSQTGPRAWWGWVNKQVNEWGSIHHSSSTCWDCLCASPCWVTLAMQWGLQPILAPGGTLTLVR